MALQKVPKICGDSPPRPNNLCSTWKWDVEILHAELLSNVCANVLRTEPPRWELIKWRVRATFAQQRHGELSLRVTLGTRTPVLEKTERGLVCNDCGGNGLLTEGRHQNLHE